MKERALPCSSGGLIRSLTTLDRSARAERGGLQLPVGVHS